MDRYDLTGPIVSVAGDGAADIDIEAGGSLLVAGPPLVGKQQLSFRLLDAGLAADQGAVVVSNRASTERIREEYAGLFDRGVPVGVVDSLTKHHGQGTIRDTDTVRYVSSPEDMTGLGIQVSELLEALVASHDANRVLFDSVSTLLMYSDLQTVFRFLHVFTSRVESADALGLFTLDSTAHESQVPNTLRQLFDGVIRVEVDAIDVQLPDATVQLDR